MKQITKNLALKLFEEIGEELNKIGLYATLDVYGGVAMMLSFMSQYSSDDRDIRFSGISYDKFYEIVNNISKRYPKLSNNWIDEGVSVIIKNNMKHETLTYTHDFGSLRIRQPSAEQLLAMKIFAARMRVDKNDLDHAIVLCRDLGVFGRFQLENILKKYFKEESIKNKNRSRDTHNATHNFIDVLVKTLQDENRCKPSTVFNRNDV